MNCIVCGKPIQDPISDKCSLDCARLWQSRMSKVRPPARHLSVNSDIDISNVLVSSDNHIQVEIFEHILDSLNIKHARDFVIDTSHYDLLLPDIRTLICANTTLSSNMYAIDNPIRSNRDRVLLAKIYDYRCINIYDWDDYIKILTSLIPKQRISAHNCQCQLVSNAQADMFYTMYNFDGPYKTTIHYGLFYHDTLVACMSFAARNSSAHPDQRRYKLCRFCTDNGVIVQGGASKLFNAFVAAYSPTHVTVQCDCDKFSGDVFSTIGMKLSNVNTPQKIWSKGIQKEYGAFVDSAILQRKYNITLQDGENIHQAMINNGWTPVMTAGYSKYTWQSKVN